MMRRSIPSAAACAALLLAGCAGTEGRYPSLARRDIERIPDVPPEAATPAPEQAESPPSPELAARLDGLVAQARTAHDRFLAHQDRTRALVNAAAGAEVASENWSVASIALADLEASRSEAMIALADLDALYAAERVAGNRASAIAAARDAVTALVAQEDAVLAELAGGLAS